MLKRSLSRRLAIVGFLQGLTASKSVRKLRTFGVDKVKGSVLMNINEEVNEVSSMMAESPKKNCQP